jgi:hypothetical protein
MTRCLPPGELHCSGPCIHSTDQEHKNTCAREGRGRRGAGTVVLTHLRLPTGSLTTSTTRLPPLPLLSPLSPSPPLALSPAPNPPGGHPARRGWSVDAAPVSPPPHLRRGRNVDRCVSRLRMPSCAHCVTCAANLSARSFMPWPACARTCRKRTVVPSARRAARARACCARPAPCSCATPMRQSWCRSRSASTSSPGRASSRAPQLVADCAEFFLQWPGLCSSPGGRHPSFHACSVFTVNKELLSPLADTALITPSPATARCR